MNLVYIKMHPGNIVLCVNSEGTRRRGEEYAPGGSRLPLSQVESVVVKAQSLS
jgi:hypothetical protein